MSNPTTFNIGQSIFILSSKNQTIVPAIVHSRHIEETVGIDNQIGQTVSYKIKLGPPGKTQIIDLNRLDGDTFSDLEEIRSRLVEELTDFVNKLIKATEEKALKWYGISSRQGGNDLATNYGAKLDADQILSAIENQIPIQSSTNQNNLLIDNNQEEQIGTIMPDGTIRPAK